MRRDGRVVDGGGLENHCTRKGTGGSNPSPSARLRHARRLSNRTHYSRANTRTLFAGTTSAAEVGQPSSGGPSARTPPGLPAAVGLKPPPAGRLSYASLL